MALRHVVGVLAAALICVACGGPDAAAPEGEALEPLSVTRWTDKTELFAEYPPMVAGETSRFAIHLTELTNFKAVTSGQVEVRLQGDGGAPEIFRVDAPSRPGIFGVDVKPSRAGARVLVIALRSGALTDEHRVPDVTVYPNLPAARAAVANAPEEAEGVSFLKEQQWALDFGTAVVRERAVRESIRVPAQITPRPGGSAEIVAPVDGRLIRVAPLTSGHSVAAGQELVRLLPPPAVADELPVLQQERAEAAAALELATRDRERAERLTSAGAAPQKRLEEARALEAQAIARVRGVEGRLTQNTAARTGTGAEPAGLFILRAPISGVLAAREATTGANVSAGSLLFRVVDASLVHVVGRIPEAQAAYATRITAAEIELADREPMPLPGRPASLARELDTETRTLPIVFTADNRVLRLPLGQGVFLRLLMAETPPRPVVPASSIVDDAGRPIVFVQTGGESFEPRPVTLGARESDFVQVLEGVKPGERVVSKGAYLVRLASLSTQVPAHGHVH